MLNALRRGSKGYLATILIGLLIISLAIFGISGFVNQIDPTEVARAGDTPVPAREFQRVYQRALGTTSQQMGRGLTPQEAQAVGLPTQVLSRLVTEAMQVDAAHDLGVDIGDEALAERIRNNPVFSAPNGEFDRIRFDQLLNDNQYTEAEFIELQRNAAAQEMFVNALVGGIAAPTAYLEAFNRFQNQTRRVSYFTLSDDMLGPIPDPTDAELRSYYDDHKSDFRAPEYRGFSTVTLSADALANPDEVSADAVERAYNVAGAYGSPERRRIQQIILDDKDVAEKAAEELNNGAAFSAVLLELGRTLADVDLGFVERSGLVDPAVADAAFNLDEKGAAAVDGRFGPVLVRVAEIQAEGKRPLDEVEGEIRAMLAQQDAAAEMREMFNSVEDAVAGGAPVAEIAERFSLPRATYDKVDETGGTPAGTAPDPEVTSRALAVVFASDVGDDATPIEDGDVYTWVQLESVTEAADRPYDDVAGDVLVAWTEDQKVGRLAEKAEEALKAIQNGEPMEDVATGYGAEVSLTEPFSQGSPATDLPQPAPAAAFEGPEGHAVSVIAENGDHVVMRVAEVSEPAFFEADADLQAARGTLNEGVADSLLYEFVNAWQAEVGATVNQPVLDMAIGLGPPQHSGYMR